MEYLEGHALQSHAPDMHSVPPSYLTPLQERQSAGTGKAVELGETRWPSFWSP